MRKSKEKKPILRASFGKIGYINIASLNTGSISKSVYGRKNPKKLQNALKEASKLLDELYEEYY